MSSFRRVDTSLNHCSFTGVGMRGIPVSEKYRGIKSNGIIYILWFAKYCGIPSGGIDFQQAFVIAQFNSSHLNKF